MQRADAADASVFRGVEGYATSNHIRTTRIPSLSEDLSKAIAIVEVVKNVVRGQVPP